MFKEVLKYVVKLFVTLVLISLFISNIQIQQCNANGDITGMYNVVNCYNVLQKGFWK